MSSSSLALGFFLGGWGGGGRVGGISHLLSIDQVADSVILLQKFEDLWPRNYGLSKSSISCFIANIHSLIN